jgi:hypothetical protein
MSTNWIILIDGKFFVKTGKTSEEFPNAQMFKNKRLAMAAVNKHPTDFILKHSIEILPVVSYGN